MWHLRSLESTSGIHKLMIILEHKNDPLGLKK